MVYTMEEIKEKIQPIAEKYEIPAIYLFGSYARNEADEDSDIDLAIE
ncbi:nucleotidyltransferase family protein, partial [Streptococcus iniae]